MSIVYVIESVCNRDGSEHKREGKRKGQRVELGALIKGAYLRVKYLDDGNKTRCTTKVREFLQTYDGYGLRVIVATHSVVYTFVEEGGGSDRKENGV